MNVKRILFLSILLVSALLLCGTPAYAGLSTFDDLILKPGSYWDGDDDGTGYGTFGGFTSGDNYFVNYQYTGWSYWDGFAYSNTTDTTTPGVDNQYSAITGGGVNDSSNYAVAYTLGMSGQPSQTYNGFTTGEYAQVVDGFYATNTTWAFQSMTNGDGFAKAFGGSDGTDEDWFLLTIYALDEDYAQTGASVEFYLADYRFADSSEDYILDEWTWVDLSGLGAVYGLEFELSSSDGGSGYSMNTPGYFAMDNLTTSTVPVPAAVWLLGSGLLGLIGIRRRS
jgi:hypothetical protein